MLNRLSWWKADYRTADLLEIKDGKLNPFGVYLLIEGGKGIPPRRYVIFYPTKEEANSVFANPELKNPFSNPLKYLIVATEEDLRRIGKLPKKRETEPVVGTAGIAGLPAYTIHVRI